MCSLVTRPFDANTRGPRATRPVDENTRAPRVTRPANDNTRGPRVARDVEANTDANEVTRRSRVTRPANDNTRRVVSLAQPTPVVHVSPETWKPTLMPMRLPLAALVSPDQSMKTPVLLVSPDPSTPTLTLMKSSWVRIFDCDATAEKTYRSSSNSLSLTFFVRLAAAPCASSPCLNGGMCVSAGKKYVCYCAPSFVGRNCASRA